MLEKEDKKNKKSQLLIVVGFFLISISIAIPLFNFLTEAKERNKEKSLIKKFYEEQEQKAPLNQQEQEDTSILPTEKKEVKHQNQPKYVAIIKIPKINLERGLVAKNSSDNNVNKNIQILDESATPETPNGNVILAAHSGNSNIAYFRYLYKLVKDDEVIIDYNNHSYIYKVTKIYDIDKTGAAEIVRNKNKKTLTLITCRQGTKKQIIVICELSEII